MTHPRVEIPLPDMRRRRAEMFTAMVMREVEPHLDRSKEALDHRVREQVYMRLSRLFAQIGVDVLTDFDREQIGLPLRGDQGWTADELRAYEHAKVQAFSRPIFMGVDLAREEKP